MHLLFKVKTYLGSIPGFFGIRTEEEPAYEVLEQNDHGFEVRQYGPTVQAQTVVPGDREAALDEGFRRLAGYIFGKNQGNKEIEMTTPVQSQPQDGRPIEMTTPVIQQESAGSWKMAFILPSEFTLESAPKPNDDRVELLEVDSKTVAVLRYTGNNTDEKMQSKADELKQLVHESKWKPVSQIMFAQYDQPFAIPLLKRNQVQLEVIKVN